VVLEAATAEPAKELQRALTEASATLTRETSAAEATYKTAKETAQSALTAAVSGHDYQGLKQRRDATWAALTNATTAKTDADAALKSITDHITDYRATMQMHTAPQAKVKR